MKRIKLLALLCILFVGNNVRGQQYRFEYDFQFKHKVLINIESIDLQNSKIKTQSGHTINVNKLYFYTLSSYSFILKDSIDYDASYGTVTDLDFDTGSVTTDYHSHNHFSSCISLNTTSIDWGYLLHGYDVTIADIACYPLIQINGKIINMQGQEENATSFPEKDNLIIEATPGFNPDLYQWEYATNQTQILGLPVYNWQPVPKDLAPANLFKASAQDLLKENVANFYGKNIYFRMQLSCNRFTDILTFKVLPSAPHILSVSSTQETCNNSGDGQLDIQFDRALYSSENLYLTFKNKNTGLMDTQSQLLIDPATLKTTITDLSAETYDIGLYGTYRYGTNLADTINTYIEGESHHYSITIPERPKVSYTLWQDSTHCQAGRDGKVWVKATGGVGKYYAYLFEKDKQDTLQQITLLKDIPQAFNELKKGGYEVHLVDTNYCVPPVNPVQYMDVQEPDRPLQIYNIAYEEPLGFGLSNGKAWAYITGGTETYSAVWKDSQGNVLTSNPLTPAGDSWRSEVGGLKKGKYYLYATDRNYPAVNPKTQENECGCMAVDSIFVDEPPKLLVNIAEKHYVTCYGDNDGELIAHAIGGRPLDSQQFPYAYQWYKVSKDSLLLETFNKNDSILTDLYSARYVVRVTDRNGIQATSNIFHLDQPDPLIVKTNILQQIRCDGEETGQMEAIVTGGTPPYSYFWETGDTARILSGLPRGIYSVYVRDARYFDSRTHFCSEEAHGEIKSPNPIKIKASLQHPTCNAYSDGKINLEITGGVAPYSCLWSDNVTTQNRTGLPGGTYQITITDANGCFVSETYQLQQPAALVVDIGNDITLCKNRTETLNGSLHIAGLNYSWTKDGRILSTDSLCTVGEAGVYRLTVTNEAGCSAYDEITVTLSEVELIPDFVLASQIPNNTKVYAVNIIRTGFDRIEWVMPDEAVVTEELPDRIQFSIARNGSYTVGMIAYKGDCRDMLYKKVEVLDKNRIAGYDDDEPFLKQFVVYPNPNDGHFAVLLELREPAAYSLLLYNSQGLLVEKKEYTNSIGGEAGFDNALSNGVYYLRFLSAEITSVFKIIVQ